MGLLNSDALVENPYYGMSSLMPKMVPANYLAYLHAMMNGSPGAMRMPMINPVPSMWSPKPNNVQPVQGLLGTVRG